MAEVLIGEYVDSKNCIQCVKLREWIDHGCKEKLCNIALDLYFLTRIVVLWRSWEKIASIIRILHTEEQKTTQQTIRRCKKKKQVSRAVSACYNLVARYLESRFANISSLSLASEV